MSEKIKVVLADDHSVVRKGIKMLISGDESIEILGEAASGTEALQMVKSMGPNIIITDISMPGMSGIELAEKIKTEYPSTKVLVLSTHNDEEYILRSFEAGALGYLPKDTEEDEFLAAIKTVADGDVYYTNEVSNILTKSLIKQKRSFDDTRDLTEREKEILKLIVEGLSNKEIGDKLFISVRTVDTHRRNIMDKIEAKNTAELVRKAIEDKLI
ncbi:MAG: response regulator transcription factor [Cytophagales bacterium]|nr:response regulator transcription factor [Cytophagales bacterium]